MICFEDSVNAKRLATGGIPGTGVLSTILTWVRHRKETDDDVFLRLGGLDTNTEPGEHLVWTTAPVRAGDVVQIKVLEQERADAPRTRSSDAGPKATARQLLQHELSDIGKQAAAMKARAAAIRRELKKLDAAKRSTATNKRTARGKKAGRASKR